eukprot:133621_1
MKTSTNKKMRLNSEFEEKSETIGTNNISTKSSSVCLPFDISSNDNTIKIDGNRLFLSDKFSMNVDGLWNVELGVFAVIIQTGIASKMVECEIEQWLPHDPRLYFKLDTQKGKID